jgi:hypothetical protein
MSVLGHQSVAEVRDQIAYTDHRFDAIEKAVKSELLQTVKDENGNDIVINMPSDIQQFNQLHNKWHQDRDAINAHLAFLSGANALVPDDLIPDQDDWDKVYAYTNTHDPGTLRDLESRIEGILGHPIDVDTDRPAYPSINNDPDIHVLQSADAALSTAQAAASAAGNAVSNTVGQAVKSNVGLLALGGLGLLIGGVVIAKVYL